MPLTTTPGHCWIVLEAASRSFAGNVIGSLPEKLVAPNNRRATALPSSWPGYHASATAWMLLSHGIRTGPPSLSTTIVRGLAAATAKTSAS